MRRWLISLLVLAVVAAAVAAWVLTRQPPPLGPWVGVTSVHADGFTDPFGIAMLSDGAVVVTDGARIRRIDVDGRVTTVVDAQEALAGSGQEGRAGSGQEGRAGSPSPAPTATPAFSALAVAPDGSLVVADSGTHTIRRVTMKGTLTTIAGDGTPGYQDGAAPQARFSGPVGVAVDRTGRIIVADTYNDRIRAIERDGTVRTIAGGDSVGTFDGPGPQARFDTPCGVAVAPDGRILVADTGNGLLRAIAPDGVVTTLATTGVPLERPTSLAVAEDGEVFIADEGGAIVAVDASGQARVIAGDGSGFQDGEGADARFRRPSGIALWPSGTGGVGPALRAGRQRGEDARLVIADTGNGLVRMVSPPQRVGTALRAVRLDALEVLMGRDSMRGAAASEKRPYPSPSFDAEAFARTPLLWPVAPLEGPHEVAGTFGEARGEAGAERFHAGLDVREPQGTLVRAVRDSAVSSPISTFGFGTINEGVRIGDVAYIHIRVGRAQSSEWLDPAHFAPARDATGAMVRVRAMRGARFRPGQVIGTINQFNHVHLNIGWPGEEQNPLRFRLLQFGDGIPPTIEPHGIRLFDRTWAALNPDREGPARGRGRTRRPTRLPPTEPVVVREPIRVVVDAWDQADGNPSYRRLGPYAIAWQLIDGTGGPVPGFEHPRETIRFDRMRRDPEAPRQVYARGSGIPVYGASRTQFLYVATTTFQDGRVEERLWDPWTVAPGPYVIRVIVRDFSGNQTSRDLKIEVVR